MSRREADREADARETLLMRAIDGELSAGEREEFARLLEGEPELRAEWERLQRLKEVTKTMRLKKPPDEVWDGYWAGVYRRLERGIAWILVSVAAIILLGWGAYHWVGDVLGATDLPPVIRWTIVGGTVGLVILFVSVAREKIQMWKSDSYKDVVR